MLGLFVDRLRNQKVTPATLSAQAAEHFAQVGQANYYDLWWNMSQNSQNDHTVLPLFSGPTVVIPPGPGQCPLWQDLRKEIASAT